MLNKIICFLFKYYKQNYYLFKCINISIKLFYFINSVGHYFSCKLIQINID